MLGKGENCCGCGACVQVCPKHCITLVSDAEGFDYPYIDERMCIECKICETSCPLIEDMCVRKHDSLKRAMAVYAKDSKLRMKSSSGGVFGLLANYIIQKKGWVVGAAFDKNMMVHHIAVNNKDDLKQLQGSKYLQSRIEHSYSITKKLLEDGNPVLFSGTACQIAGLKTFLKKDYDSLYTVDVLCHGVPSSKVWKRYLDWQTKRYGCDVRRIFFRNKKYGWKMFAVSLEFTNDTVYEQIFTKDLFMQLFLQNICLRPSCYNCKFKDINRCSDITLGDCWGIEHYLPEMDDDKGTSVVIIHTLKGSILLDAIRPEIEYKEAELDMILPPSADSRKSVMAHENRKLFFALLNKKIPFNYLDFALCKGKREKLSWLLRKVRKR